MDRCSAPRTARDPTQRACKPPHPRRRPARRKKTAACDQHSLAVGIILFGRNCGSIIFFQSAGFWLADKLQAFAPVHALKLNRPSPVILLNLDKMFEHSRLDFRIAL